LLFACVVNQGMAGQNPEPRAIPNPETGVRIAQAVRADHAPRLDGTLEDPIWQQAPAIDDFKQREPYEGQPATERTEVRVLYTRNEVYFGVACHDSVENGPVATQLRRDVTQELDDYFEIVIDSRFDRRNAYVFQVNPLGTQRDAVITDEQVGDTQDGDPGWDGVWTSEAHRTRDGWTATIAIPFSTLNFMRSRDVVWGVNFKRFIRRKNEEDQWSGWRRIFGASKISQAGELHGITEIGSGRLFIVKPYVLGGFSHFPANATASGLTPGAEVKHDAWQVPRICGGWPVSLERSGLLWKRRNPVLPD
jgi:Carbohydrate family 9 binding domain-like